MSLEKYTVSFEGCCLTGRPEKSDRNKTKTKQETAFHVFHWKPKMQALMSIDLFSALSFLKHTEHFGLFELSLGQKVQFFLDFYAHRSMHNRLKINTVISFWMQMESSLIFSAIHCSKMGKKWLEKTDQDVKDSMRWIQRHLVAPQRKYTILYRDTKVSNDNNICVKECQNINNNMLPVTFTIYFMQKLHTDGYHLWHQYERQMYVRTEELLRGCWFAVPPKVKSSMLSCQPVSFF